MEVMQRRPQVQDLLGPLSPGVRQLEGKTFYLDAVRSRSSALLAEAIARLGGKVESFLNKDVTFVVSGSRDNWQGWQSVQEGEGPKKVAVDSPPVSSHHRQAQGSCSSTSQRTATPRPQAYRSRGRALLERAIRSNERCPATGVLANAVSWGIKILHVDEFLLYLNRLTEESSRARSRELQKMGKSSAWVVKAGTLKSPYIKIEDSSRKYRPLHTQSAVFPMLDFTGKFSPFEPPAPLPLTKRKNQEDDQHIKAKKRNVDAGSSRCTAGWDLPPTLTPSPPRMRRKTQGFCECCQLSFKEQAEHLQSDQHRQFARDESHYVVVDRLISLMQPNFSEIMVHGHMLMRSPPQFFHTHPCLDLEPQVNSDAEQALQALLSPFQPNGSPAAQEMEDSRSTSITTSTAPSVSPKQEAVKSVPADFTPCITVASTVCPLQQSCKPQTRTACGTRGGEAGSGPRKLTEDVAKCSSPPSARPLISRNGRKRGRSCSLSPRVRKKRRTTASVPFSRCAAVPAALHGEPYLRPPLNTRVTPATARPQLLTTPPPGEASSSDQLVYTAVRPDTRLAAGEIPCTSTEDELLGACGAPGEGLPPVLCNEMLPPVTPSASGGQLGLVSSGVALGKESDPPLTPLGSTHKAPLPVSATSATALHQTVPSLLSPPPFQLVPLPSPPQGSHPLLDDSPDSSPAPLSHSFSSVRIEASLLPDPSACSPSSSVSSDWDCDLLSWMSRPAAGGGCILDLEFLQRPCMTVRDVAYESRLCSVLHPPTPPRSLCEEDTDPTFRTFEHTAETPVAQ
ncbi:uncharacterized protein dbf4b [Brienomyrus brachyistius]|uniref:uncharacterized protein dbf4b n=1 Tax=Brienomyrus brachyistius TaxID=42636 RepID=UPI0020B26074|nr:uncharacterized protein dbf4b [Brienomyrus brachyistius]XP_048871072.1 uncharacterized protein dbf4b [Brienomyrus brachyistius]